MRLFVILFGCLGFVAVPRLITPRPTSDGVRSAMEYFTARSRDFATSCTALRRSIESPSFSPSAARLQLVECRIQYKKIESFLEYFFRSSSTIYNRPPKFEAEEPGMEYQSPVGLQVIESLLFEDSVDRTSLLQQASAIESSAADLPALLYDFKGSDQQVLESLRLGLIRIIALDITGYESPLLKSGIAESGAALESLSQQLQPFLQASSTRTDSLSHFLQKALAFTRDNIDFDAFDRLAFLQTAALPLQRQLRDLITNNGLGLNTNPSLNYDAGNIFSPDALIPPGLPAHGLIQKGRQLFFDPTLSINSQKSCASCHNPKNAFSDGLPKSLAFDNHSLLDRNTPTLLYSGYQHSQFWDGRAPDIETQIRSVLANPKEMNADTTEFSKHGGIDSIVAALSAYLRSLHPLNSPFDRYLRGERGAISDQAKKGANLFMGKAQCATCHFIPLFNGLIPPCYAHTEFEVLGTPDSDAGRFNIYPFPFYKGAFKTPTVRNAALTGPYMHDGSFQNLDTVLNFYNKGTLSSPPLHLTSDEISDIILFIHTLTDNIPVTYTR